MPKTQTIELLHELDHVAGRATGHAVEEAFGRTEDQIGRVVAVTVEGTFAHPVLASVFFEREAASSGQSEKVGFAFHAIDVGVGDSRHLFGSDLEPKDLPRYRSSRSAGPIGSRFLIEAKW